MCFCINRVITVPARDDPAEVGARVIEELDGGDDERKETAAQ